MDLSQDFRKVSTGLPLGQMVPLSTISGPTYVTPQLLVQQIAYQLSDKIFSFSPDTFDLDVAVRDWAAKGEANVYGRPTSVVPLQTRAGAGTFALGYIFSKDFDLSKRHIPQTLLAPSLSLRHLRESLDQLSLLYSVASPFVAHIAAVDYSAQDGYVSEYESALQLADELGLGLVSSTSASEAQHMALFATQMAAVLPSIHIYDGVRAARETSRVVDTLGPVAIKEIYRGVSRSATALSGLQDVYESLNKAALALTGIKEIYESVSKAANALNKRLDNTGRVLELLKAFNDELGTDYEPFEYFGHRSPETVYVVFGSAEAQISSQVVSRLAANRKKIGVINVRIYRPFIEEAFLDALPSSVQQIVVLGQVRDNALVEDSSVQSLLYSDVLTTIAFSGKWSYEPSVIDFKYAASTPLSPDWFLSAIQQTTKKGINQIPQSLSLLEEVQQYTFWDVDDSAAVNTPAALGHLLAQDSTNNVYVNETHDNLVQGGIVRTDIRTSKKAVEAPYAVERADIVYVGDERLLKDVAVVRGVAEEGTIVLRLPNFKDEDAEKRIPATVRKEVADKKVKIYVLDSGFSPAAEKNVHVLAKLAFLKLVKPAILARAVTRSKAELSFFKVSNPRALAAAINGESSAASSLVALKECSDALDQAFREVPVKSSWADASVDAPGLILLDNVIAKSFGPFEKIEPEPGMRLDNWHAAAKGLVFREVYETERRLRPDQTVNTFTVHVKENRRLTPTEYNRNIFHIEFDLGSSGLTYNIGEALGIHAENDPEQVREFIDFYGLDADLLVQVPSRDDPLELETRTVYQSLVQNIDILGKPPKRFYEALAEFATDETEKKKLTSLGGKEGTEEFKKRCEVDTVTYADILEEFQSAHPSFSDLVRIVAPLKRREYSIASAQAVTPNSVALMIVVVDWVDTKGRTRYGQATNYLSKLPVGTAVTVSVKPSVMKLPAKDTAPLIMAGLGTGLAPFRAFVQYRAMQKAQGKEIGAILLYLGSRHQREEYLYGEEWEAYLDAGVITLLGAAFSRDQPQKIYIQDRMRQTMKDIVKAYIEDDGSFYLCGPTWPVPDVTEVLQEAIAAEAKASGRKVNARNEIERLKEAGRYVLEVY